MTCATCRHSLSAAKDKMPGWIICALSDDYTYRPPQKPCVFEPVRWIQK